MSSKTKYIGYNGDEYEIPGGLKWDKRFSISQLETAWFKCYGEKLPEQYDGFIKELISIASTLEIEGRYKSTEDFTFDIMGAHYCDTYKVEKLIRDNLDEMLNTGKLWEVYQLPIVEVFDDVFYNQDDEYEKVKKDIRNFDKITITVNTDNQEIESAKIDGVQ
jgi:hypothetical protein|tara:strand:+ start:420 stop:908 length:489 start_codon:yes stop_codon:yes gene_type:complete